MSPKYTHAIVARISEALLESGPFDVKLAKHQHEQYCTLLREIGLDVIELPPDDLLPEGVFVENSAVICNGVALIGRSDNAKRRHEAASMAIILKKELDIPIIEIDDPHARLDGGDVLFTGREFFIGISGCTNEEGARAVAMAYPEYPVTPIRVNGSKRLKYYVTMAGRDVLCVSKSAPCQEIVKRMEREASFTYQKLTLPEESAANMLYINGTIVHRSPTEIPDAYKTLKEKIDIPTRNINISEFSQYSSGLTSSCLLLRRWKSIRSI
ncbi:N(G),N(G)-dimethylarginine dimethylaminohydrolase 1 isoform X1 [Drosophila guanche]|uniref:Blast:N(G),N(G)-dimethylarginine dimethylaminohydrolase 1 n=1 Tax=Drosophila guanche TaxID=7266 RepID=A0A3B0KM06_DROGU|nr:N(G),N(G)-dimethylarginine dimethylaminohydrolase 1 isoform X1 [Drosophila guanche]SPP89660.1 blast:N(G)%2CN(G)-dimethylarginine dimethylaminohydrolase 1 [Drosophila guanche]